MYGGGKEGPVFSEDYLEVLGEVVRCIAEREGVDLSGYRQPMLLRRLQARMAVLGVDRPEDYASYLKSVPEESRTMLDHIAVNSSSFFRDPLVWEWVSHRVLPELAGRFGNAGPLRFWSAGCAAGEEAYTLVMLAQELARRRRGFPEVQVFGSDIDAAALRIGRKGIFDRYTLLTTKLGVVEGAFDYLGEERYQLRPEIASQVTFSRTDLLGDRHFAPPVAGEKGFHLVCLRNVTIYLSNEETNRLMERILSVLLPGGYLLLGLAEAVPRRDDLSPVDVALRIFRRNDLRSRVRHADPESVFGPGG